MKKKFIILKVIYSGYILGNTIAVESVVLCANGKQGPIYFDSEMDALIFLDNEITAQGNYTVLPVYQK